MSEDKNSSPGPWAYASEGTQLAVTLLVGFFVGYRVDRWKGTLPWFTLIGAVGGIILGLYNFLKKSLKQP